MFSYIKGLLVQITPLQAIVEANGIGYTLLIPLSVLDKMPEINQTIQLYTSFVVREFSHTLYGFLHPNERDAFEVLLNVTGIGPKLALSLIGALSLTALQTAIVSQDIITLCKVPGVGKKTAERLIVELKDKLTDLVQMAYPGESIVVSHKDPRKQQIQDALLALINLGYHQSKAQKAIQTGLKELPEQFELVTLITCALKHV